MKTIFTLFAVVALVAATNITPSQSASGDCVQPKGELLGTITQLESQGYRVSSIDCASVSYFAPPTPPYVNRMISVVMRKFVCYPETGLCALLGTAKFTADEVVVNDNGNSIQVNVSSVYAAL